MTGNSYLSTGTRQQVITQEFHLSITPVGSDRYLIRTEDVAPGVPLAEIQVDWPVDTWLQQAADWHEDPLTSLLTAGDSPQAAARLALGQTLYDALFQGRLRDSWLAAQGVAQYLHKVLRLRLGFKDSRLQRLPWELLYGDDRSLATSTDVTFARYYMGPALGEPVDKLPLSEGQPLQVLVVISSPNDQERLALKQEVSQLQQELLLPSTRGQSSSQSIAIQLTLLEQPGRAELVNALEQGKFHMLHYAGHSEISETGGDLFLVSSQTGLTERLTGEDLAGLLVNNHIRLAVFNSCRGAYTSSDDAETGWREQNLVQSLINRGVPGVIAMAERIPDNVATAFTQLLYRNLNRGYPIDLSLSRTRQGIITTFGSDQIYWMLPILYMHPAFDGYLYGEHPNRETLDPWLLDEEELDLSQVMTEAAFQEEADLENTELQTLLASESDSSHDQQNQVVAELQQQLSEFTTPAAPAAPAAPDSPQPPAPLPAAAVAAPAPASSPASEEALPEAAVAEDARSPQRPLPRRWLIGFGALGAAVVIVSVLSLFDWNFRNSEPLPPLSDQQEAPLDVESPAVVNAIAALNQGDTETVLDIGEDLLDQNNLEAVEGILLQATPTQREESPEIAYLEGRWHWQNSLVGTSSIEDAWRAWKRAVEKNAEFTPALVALGFAEFAQGEDWQAVDTWKAAISADSKNLQDLNPNSLQVSDTATENAYAGLAMAYAYLSRISTDEAEARALLVQAEDYFNQAVRLNPALLQPYRLSWLWAPVADEWQKTIDVLSQR